LNNLLCEERETIKISDTLPVRRQLQNKYARNTTWAHLAGAKNEVETRKSARGSIHKEISMDVAVVWLSLTLGEIVCDTKTIFLNRSKHSLEILYELNNNVIEMVLETIHPEWKVFCNVGIQDLSEILC